MSKISLINTAQWNLKSPVSSLSLNTSLCKSLERERAAKSSFTHFSVRKKETKKMTNEWQQSKVAKVEKKEKG